MNIFAWLSTRSQKVCVRTEIRAFAYSRTATFKIQAARDSQILLDVHLHAAGNKIEYVCPYTVHHGKAPQVIDIFINNGEYINKFAWA